MKTVVTNCAECGKRVECRGRIGLHRLPDRRGGNTYCSEECKRAFVSRRSSAAMAATNRVHASDRMKRRNPMSDPAAKAKMSATLRAIGWKPPVRGGNGHLTVPQLALASALGWETEISVPTKAKRGTGMPTCYKLDVGNPALKLGIEVDGASHQSPAKREQDQRKEAFLRSCGWTVLRFQNQQVKTDLGSCVQVVLSTISKSRGITTTSPTEP